MLLRSSLCCFFFFLMIRRPPRSTLFPTRRSSDLVAGDRHGVEHVRRRLLLEPALGHLAAIHGIGEGNRQPERVVRELSDRDRKSTRLNSSHLVISYAVFCLKKKKHANPSTLELSR